MMTQESPANAGGQNPGPARRGRKRYWISPKLQGRFTAWLVVTTAVIGATTTLAILLALWSSVADQIVWAAGTDSKVLFWQTLLRVFLTVGILTLVFGLVAFFAGVIISHRIAGPLYRISKAAREVGQGQYHSRLNLRKRDYLHDFADTFNEMLAALDERACTDNALIARLTGKMSELENDVARGELRPDELRKRLEALSDIIREVRANAPAGQPPEE